VVNRGVAGGKRVYEGVIRGERKEGGKEVALLRYKSTYPLAKN